MAQNDFVIADQSAADALADINSALQSLASCSSGATEPSTKYANQLWYDTANHLLKMRNEANNAWINVHYIHQADNEAHIIDGTSLSDTSGNHTGLLGSQTQTQWTTGTGTTESLVSPAKINAAIQALSPDTIGEGQTWQAVTRSASTSYQNTTGRPIQVAVSLSTGATIKFQVSTDNVNWVDLFDGDTAGGAVIIPNNHYYRTTGTFRSWRELR